MFEKDKANACVKKLAEITLDEFNTTRNMLIHKLKTREQTDELNEEIQKDLESTYKSIEIKLLYYFRTKYSKPQYIHRLDAALANPSLAFNGDGSFLEVRHWTPALLSALVVYSLTGTMIEMGAFYNMNRFTHMISENALREVGEAIS